MAMYLSYTADASQAPTPALGTKSITQNGTYNASDDGYDGYSSVSANIPSSVLTTKTISSNGTYNASSDNADGYSSVTVNVPSSSGNATVIDLGEFSFASDGVITTNISSVYPDYANLTKDNFIIDITQMKTTTCQKEDWFNGVNQQSAYDTDVFYMKTSLYFEKLYNTGSGNFTYKLYSYVVPIEEVLNDSSTVGEILPYKNSGTHGPISTPTKAKIYLVVFNS